MAKELVLRDSQAELVVDAGGGFVPSILADAGEAAAYRFLEFFAAQIRNKHTRRAYFRNAMHFFSWAEYRGLRLDEIRSMHIAAYVEEISYELTAPSVKQVLATLRMLFDWLVVGQIVVINPAAAVRGPKHVVKKGKTPVLSDQEAKELFESIDVSKLPGLRDRALIGVMVCTFARIDAVLSMEVADYYVQGKRWWLRLHEKNAKTIEMPAHHKLEEFMDAYIEAAGISGKRPLFQTFRGRSTTLTGKPMAQVDAWRMIRRRAKAAGIATAIGNHSFRATSITNYLHNGGKLETAQQMAGHESSRTTGLYDRRDDGLTLDEIERISI